MTKIVVGVGGSEAPEQALRWTAVVGSRGLSAAKGALLGSVSQQVTLQATCPVVVVPEESP
jgi:nucleotide-binding universal stress UspA family protein